jgi:hypothetical protein
MKELYFSIPLFYTFWRGQRTLSGTLLVSFLGALNHQYKAADGSEGKEETFASWKAAFEWALSQQIFFHQKPPLYNVTHNDLGLFTPSNNTILHHI